MGAGFSGFVAEGSGGDQTPWKQGLGEMPESCVALVLAHLDPPQICKMALVNRAFRLASSADFVWESKLPENYRSLAQMLLDGSPDQLAKKDIYARLCRPNRFDGGTKELWMDKTSGRICVSISWKALKITGIDDRRYWNHIPTYESRFHTIAYLQQIWWLEVDGSLDLDYFPSGTYSLFFRLQLGRTTGKWLGRRVCNLDQVHGWDIKPVRFQLSTSQGHHTMSQCYLIQQGEWLLYHVGDFSVTSSSSSSNSAATIKFSMMQIDCTHTKGGLCLDSVLILPQ
ncbi:F-box protein PP2-A13 [Diospyros lotus]|uniref:F-box protein PP2-A13 n=1 Tax=Diospyros lotus TaxID=55363 RepID=UPI002255E2EB|nr:F-box protein PP2-A13 [Diospyros lotus]